MSDKAYAELPADLKRPSASYAWRHVVFIFGSIYVLLAAAYVLTAYTSLPWLALLTLPFLGAQIYKITIIMHDACHYSLFGDRSANVRIGSFAGWFIGTSFKSFGRLHWRHHARFGEDDDPQGDDYLHLDGASPLIVGWHLTRPLFGYNLFKLRQFSHSSESPPDRPSTTWRERMTFLAGMGLVQLSLAATASGLFAEPWLVLLYPFSAATFALFFSQTRGFAEHVPDPGETPVQHARTHLPNWFDRLFFYTLNFNYHIEHHRYPSVPSCHLPRVHEVLRRSPDYGESATSIVGTIMHRWRCARASG